MSYFGLPTQSIRNNTDRIVLFKQTLGDVESTYKDIGGYDKKSFEFREMQGKAWSETFTCLCTDMTKNKNEGKYRILKENKNTYKECTFHGEAF